MKIKSFLTMMVAAVAIVLGVSSCSSNDDDGKDSSDLASQVIGSYTGDETISVMGTDDTGIVTFEFSKNTTMAVDMTVPATGEGTMSFPALPVKNIPLTKSGNTITGALDSYAGTVTNASGVEKSYTISKLTVVFSGINVVITYTLQYGTMPMAMTTTFTGTKK